MCPATDLNPSMTDLRLANSLSNFHPSHHSRVHAWQSSMPINPLVDRWGSGTARLVSMFRHPHVWQSNMLAWFAHNRKGPFISFLCRHYSRSMHFISLNLINSRFRWKVGSMHVYWSLCTARRQVPCESINSLGIGAFRVTSGIKKWCNKPR